MTKESNASFINSLIALVVVTFICGFCFGYSSAPAQPTRVICESGSERLISQENEYPAWELECDSNVQVVVID